jgi:hypothetical protein
MEWMIVFGVATGVIGWSYRWFVTPEASEKRRLMNVGMTIIGFGGMLFFGIGLILFTL